MSTTGVNEVFNAFVEAQKAMQRLPEAELELAKALGEKDTIRHRFEEECARNDALREMLNAERAEVANNEAALRDATFREQQLRDKLEMLLGALKGVVGESQSAIELVEPKPEPVPEETLTAGGFTTSDPTPSFDRGSIDALPDSGGVEGVSVPSDPIPAASITGTTSPSADTAATDLPGKFPWEAPKAIDPEDDLMYAAPYGFKPTETPVAPQENPTPNVSTPSVSADPSESVNTTVAPRPYWEKPTTTFWLDWRNSGGELAPWVKGMSDDQLRFAH